MTSITQKIRRFTGGISDQPDEQKLPGQVRDAVNCTPDVVYGLLKRPGTIDIPWSDGAPSSDGKWIAYDDLENNMYVLNISSGVSRKISTNQEGIGDFRWSPDNKWLAFVQTAFNTMEQIKIYNVELYR